MEIPDDQLEKLEQIAQTMDEQFKSITGVKVTN